MITLTPFRGTHRASQMFHPKSQLHHFWRAHEKIADQNEVMQDLLFGPNPITDAELEQLIARRPDLSRFSGYIGKRPC